jgi:hypothetical protein
VNILTVKRVQFQLASKTLDGYSAGETNPVTGKFINYLSGRQLAEVIGNHHTTVVQNRMSEELKALLGKDFTVVQGSYKMASGGKTKVGLWTTHAATIYFTYHARKRNEIAFDIVCALAATSLDIIIDDQFEREYKAKQAEEVTEARLKGKVVRRTWTDYVNDWLKKNEENISQNYKKFIWSNISDAVNLAIFNRKAKKLREDWSLKKNVPLRDEMNKDELFYVSVLENQAMHILDNDIYMTPLKAMEKAIKIVYVEHSDR